MKGTIVGIMEKKTEATIMGLYRGIIGVYMSLSPNSLKADHIGDYYGGYYGVY